MTAPASIFHFVSAPGPRYLMRLRLVEQLLRSIPGPVSRFAEIGPGQGDIGLFLAATLPDATGDLIEFSEHSAAVLRQRTAGQAALTVREGDFRSMEIGPTYDLVVACEVFEHIEDDATAFDAVSSMLRPGGHLLLSVPAFMRKWQAADEYAGHFRRYEYDELSRKLAAARLQTITLWCYGFPVTHLLALPYRIYYGRQLRRRPLPQAEATKRSGSERSHARRLGVLPVPALMKPFFLLQDLVKGAGIGDGYLVLARR
ncbi:MAG: class I SAM-dependent methyltransferase [Gammaproteobacteria bacterium]|nr:class I SAM-dependent methyltransferase [Gammaproteobacteria bacterium]